MRKFVLFVLGLAACASAGDDATGEHDARTQRNASDSARAAAATRVLTSYLEASREGSPTRGAQDTLAACDAGAEAHYPVLLLARWVILPLELRGDTVVARAEVTTVGEIDIERRSGGLIGRQRIRTDILEWDVYEDDYGNWVVCNGLRFGYRGPERAVTWRPGGVSFESVRALADSLASYPHAR